MYSRYHVALRLSRQLGQRHIDGRRIDRAARLALGIILLARARCLGRPRAQGGRTRPPGRTLSDKIVVALTLGLAYDGHGTSTHLMDARHASFRRS
jgi:hypothetical protein